MKYGKFLKRNQGQEKAALTGGMETCFDGKKREGAWTSWITLPLPHNSSNIIQLLWYFFSLFSHSLDCSTFQARALILFLIYLIPAVARAFLLKSLVEIVWSLKQTSSTGSQHGVLERVLARTPESEFSSASSELDSLGYTNESQLFSSLKQK